MAYHSHNEEPKRPFPRDRTGTLSIVLPLIGAAIFVVVIWLILSNSGEGRVSLFNGEPQTTGQASHVRRR
jgi:hypothetical protein